MSRRRRRPPAGGRHHYPRTARLGELLRQVLADELERVGPDGLGLITLTDVQVDPEMRLATVYVDHLDSERADALAALTPKLKRAVADQVRAKRTPDLVFAPDPAIAAGERVDEILRGIDESGEGES